ncbi:hypothetical protein DFA_08078 [Cavenderia fasciculata]|uniref:Transmembrane protein n=1 Tax=Cavenderia fasciculata TaxID=261658 RepID=F4Q4Z0_CACFS|nr:uncharacterized protein DFA_08078 [Cavenderia fasciculata]EGG17096.1 hypothetical protein DFA_08078 [Cavenderia fasciculata]|eukprot:XP_004355580.1 hypothetical protein DFA_08078 [Cavenderia fasciculata]
MTGQSSTARTTSTQSFDNRLEDDPDIDIEDDVAAGDAKRSAIPFKRIGIGFLVASIIVAILTITIPSGIIDKIELYANGVLFRILFATFLICLFICLWCIYYLGGEQHAWEDPEGNELSLNFSNVTAIIGIVIEFVQLCSFSWNEGAEYTGSEALRNSNYLAVPYASGSVFNVMYWILFGIAFSPYIFVVSVRLLLHFFTRRFGEAYTAGFVTKYQQKIYSILWFLVNTMYLPVISTMFGGIDCTFKDDMATLDSNTSIDCLRKVHIPFIGKVILAAMTVFATSYVAVYLVAVSVVNVVFLVINVWLEPCIVSWVNRMRTAFFTFCIIATVTSWIAMSDNVARFVPLILLIIGWISFAGFYFVFYHFRLNIRVSNFFLSLLGKQVIVEEKNKRSSSIVASHPNDVHFRKKCPLVLSLLLLLLFCGLKI